jgi:predicted amidophosphoribosyltransferase
MLADPITLRLAPVLRNCYRCGHEFRNNGTERLCSACRRPEGHDHKELSPHLTLREKQVVDLVSQAKLNK